MQRASLYLVDRIDVLTVITRQQWISEQTFLIDVTNYSDSFCWDKSTAFCWLVTRSKYCHAP